jgi:ABC-type amino acid transport substrate-binding protein
MRTHTKLIVAALSATLLMAFAVGSASARNLSISNRNVRIVWTELTFAAADGSLPTTCPVTLEGSFHYNTIVKRTNSLIGLVTRAIVDNARCLDGSHATVLTATLPWHVTYQSFTGTLPNITSIKLLLVGASFLVAPFFGASCLARTTTENPSIGIANVGAGGVITGLRAEEETTIPLTGTFCPERGRFSGTGTVTLLGSTSTRIFLRLI